jgi:hypothetical protein
VRAVTSVEPGAFAGRPRREKLEALVSLPGSPDEDLAARRPPGRGFALVLAAAVVAVGLLLYGKSLRASYAFDDMDYLNLAADVLAGRRSYLSVVLRPHLEHFVPLLRVAFHASAALFGVDALAFRLSTLLAHLGAGFLLGLVARQVAGSAAAGYAAGLAYVLPAGFSSMWIWLMTGAGMPWGILCLTGALAAWVYRRRIGRRTALALIGAGLIGMTSWEGTLAPLAALPALVALDELRRDRRERDARSLLALSVAALAAAVGLATWARLRQGWGGFVHLDLRHGLPRAAFLALAAPYRYLFPAALPAPDGADDAAVLRGGILLGLVVLLGMLLVLLALWQQAPATLARWAAFAAVGPLAWLVLVGSARAASYRGLYDADRYFFPLLLPCSLFAGVLAAAAARRAAAVGWSPGRRRLAASLLAAGLAVELLLHARALDRRISWGPFASHRRRFEQLAALAGGLHQAARALPRGSPPLAFPDDDFWFSDVHNGRISARTLLFVLDRHRDPRLVLGGREVGPRDAELLNRAIAGWLRELGEPAGALAVVSGSLVDARDVAAADFRQAPFERAVVQGFFAPEPGGRWMGESGELRLRTAGTRLSLTASVPAGLLRVKDPLWPGVTLRVVGLTENGAERAELGTIRVADEQPATWTFDAAFLRALTGPGRPAILVLRADRTWRPPDILPGSLDDRRLSVRLARAAFE